MEGLLVRYGALAVLVGAAVEGDVTMILAGVLVHLRLLEAPVAFACGILGAVASDCFYFALARRAGPWLRQTRAYQRVAPTIERFARRLGSGAIVAARLLYGTRIATLVFWGMHGLGWARFLILDLIGCVLWAILFGGIGFVLSNSATAVIGHVKAVEHRLLFAVVGAVALVLVLRALTRSRLADDRK